MYDNYNIKYIATGHYCRVQYSYNNDENDLIDEDVDHDNHYNNYNNSSSNGFDSGVNNIDHHHHHKVQLLRGVDSYKDQSYFLSFTTV